MYTNLPAAPFESLSRFAKNAFAAILVALCMSSCASTAPGFGEKGYSEQGKASYYARKFQGRTMANGEKYRRGKLTAAHKELPFGTKVKVTNTQTRKTVKVEITDRGPFVRGRIIDLSEAAARRVGMLDAGVAPVKMKVVKAAKAR